MKKEVAEKTNPSLWRRIVSKIKKENRYGKPNSWNARKAQYAVKVYKDNNGGYKGKKTKENSLTKWTKQNWQYSSKKSQGKGRYLPEKVWDKLTKKEKDKENQKKREATKKGKPKAKYSKKIAKLIKD